MKGRKRRKEYTMNCKTNARAEQVLFDAGYIEHRYGHGWIRELEEQKRWHAFILDNGEIRFHKDITKDWHHNTPMVGEIEWKREKERINSFKPKQPPPKKKVKKLKPLVYQNRYPLQELKRKILNNSFIIKLRRLLK